ncbi:lamin tail domain-containing protein [Mariniblastus sp.]|nr:lamin tail domain-containing protein [Mariniblastus sp.]
MFSKPLAFVSGTLLKTARKTFRTSKSQNSEYGYSSLEPRQLLATIAWSTSIPIEDSGAFVDNSSGSLVAAINSDDAGDDAFINGVNFLGTNQAGWNNGVTGVGGVTITSDATNGNFGNTFVQGSGAPVGITNGGAIDNLVSSGIWNPQTVTLNGLTPGDTYFLQVIGNDSRDGRTESYVTLLGDGTGTGNFTGRNFLSNSVSGGQTNLPGSAISGTFVADSSFQTFEVAGELNGSSNNGRAQINAFQLRSFDSSVLLPGAVPLINEFSASNSSVIDDDNGNSSDWIEIYNAGEDSIDLAGYSLTDDAANPTKYVFPSTTLGGGEYLIVFAGDDDAPTTGTDLYTGFGLSAGGEYLGFFDDVGNLVSEFGPGGTDYPAQFSDVSYGIALLSVGGPNNVAGDLGNFPTGATITLDTFGSNYDTELGLYTADGFYVADNDDASGVQSQIIQSGLADGVYYASVSRFFTSFGPENFNVVSSDGGLGNFVLNANGNSLTGTIDGSEVKFFRFSIGPEDASDEASNVGYFSTPTPGAANSFNAADGVIESLPTVSVDRGFYDEAFTVNVASQTAGAILVYTTDGTQPSLNNGIQVQPANSTAFAQTNILISTTTSLRTGVFTPNFFTREFTTHSYVFLDDVLTSDVLNRPEELAPYSNQELRDALLSLPTVSFNFNDTINNSQQPEQRTSVEWLDGSDRFQLDAGIGGFGGNSTTDFQKKNFRLHFRSEYGASKLEFPLFEGFDDGVTPATDTFDQLEFRSGSHDRNGRGFGLSNRFVDETLLDAGHKVPHGRFVHLYINGEYWGQYHMRERWNDDFLASYHGGEEEDYEAINGNINNGNSTPNGWDPGTPFDGTGAAWNNINNIVAANLTASQRFAALQQTVDLDQYIDYMLVWMAGQAENEYRSGGSTDGSVPYTFYLNDADGWLRDPVDGSGGQRGDKTGNAGPANILGRLVSEGDPEFLTYYADRIQRMFYNDGPLSTAQSVARLQEIIDQVDQSVILEAARWSFSGEPNGGGSLTVAQFQSKSQEALNDFLPHILDPPANRQDPRSIIERFQDRGLFPDFDAPEHLINGVTQNGGAISAGDELTFTAGDTVYFTLDGSDPRLPGGGINPNATLFNSGASFTLNTSTIVQSRAFSSGEWSALNSALFAIPVSQSDLRITELQYNPADPSASEMSAGFLDNDDFEFIEIFNPSTTGTINLDGVQLSNGVMFDFGNVDLLPGERVVVVEDIDAFMERYGDSANVLGQWSGALNNDGERVTLIDSSAEEIMSVNYGDNDPWYNAANHGFSLVLDDPINTPVNELGKYYSWSPSLLLGGTPGEASFDRAGVVINEVLAHTDAPQSDSIELYNPTSGSINVGGWYLSDEGDDLFKYQIAAGTTIAAGGYLVFDESDFNVNSTGFALSGSEGDQVYLSQDIAGLFVGLQDSVEFDATFNGESLGRLPNGSGRLTRMAETSFGSANGEAEVGPLVISEINYHPADPIDSTITDDDLEYIEIANPTSADVDLTNWRIRGEADFDFAGGTLAAGEAILVVTFDPVTDPAKLAAFRTNYGISADVVIVGGLSESLSNSSGRIALQQPDAPDALGEIPHVVVDEVVYDDLPPWPAADGTGLSLERDDLGANASLATSWIAAVPTPGAFESPFILGDANLNGVVDFDDISPFITLLANGLYLSQADTNQDGVLDFDDISSFITILAAP